MCIINNGMKSKNNIVLVTVRESVFAHEWAQQGGCAEPLRKEVRFKAPCFWNFSEQNDIW